MPEICQKLRYRLRVKEVPVDGFWSISVYDAHALQRQLSLTAYDRRGAAVAGVPAPPAAAPEGDFRPALRIYNPDQQVLDGTYEPPPITHT